MPFSHITISITRDSDGSDASGDLNSLSIGFGLYQAWFLFMLFNPIAYIPQGYLQPSLFIPGTGIPFLFVAFISVYILCTFLLSCTDQMFLKFYVGKPALSVATALTVCGTVCSFAAEASSGSIVLLSIGGICMGVGASLMAVLWGTAFCRFELSTIILNAIIGVIIAVLGCMVLVHWVLEPLSVITAAVLPIFASVLLWRLTPIPYYRRREIPIFHPLVVPRSTFMLRFGIPTVIFGFSLGIIRLTFMSRVIPSLETSVLLVVGAAAFVSAVILLMIISAIKDQPLWDIMFRSLVPVIAIAAFFLPLLDGDYMLFACFFLACGFICLNSLMWIFFAVLSGEFRLSPIFVTGLGCAALELGVLAGVFFVDSIPDTGIAFLAPSIGSSQVALIALLSIIIGYVFLPRKREVRKLLATALPSKYKGTIELQNALEEDAKERAAQALAEAEAAAAEEAYALSAMTEASAYKMRDLLDNVTEDDIMPDPCVIDNNDSVFEDSKETHASALSSSDTPESLVSLSQDNAAPVAVSHDNISPTIRAAVSESEVDHAHDIPTAPAPLPPEAIEAASPQATQEGEVLADEYTGGRRRFRDKCMEIADRYMLSRRESEVMFLLARGHNAAYIQDKLCISRSTAKTHINHIYRKLDIHAQQELLNMVDDHHDEF